MSRRRRGILLVSLGLVLLLAGTGLMLLHDREDALAGQSAGTLLEELTYDIKYSYPVLVTLPEPGEDNASSVQGDIYETEEDSMPTRTLSGYDLVGILRIPSVGIELPVLSQWSYSLLNVAPCRYSGSLKTGDLIILGHSYKSHFRPLWQVKVGDSVEFTDVSGITHRFVAAAVDTIRGSDTDMLASDYPLTLFTCTADSMHRVVVRCEEE